MLRLIYGGGIYVSWLDPPGFWEERRGIVIFFKDIRILGIGIGIFILEDI